MKRQIKYYNISRGEGELQKYIDEIYLLNKDFAAEIASNIEKLREHSEKAIDNIKIKPIRGYEIACTTIEIKKKRYRLCFMIGKSSLWFLGADDKKDAKHQQRMIVTIIQRAKNIINLEKCI